jgi:Domain of unknown function DUF29
VSPGGTSVSDLYEQDFVGWTEQQARLLREAAAQGINVPLDWANLAEEVEGLGRSELRALESQLHRLILHLLKLEFSSARDPRAGWLDGADDARIRVLRHLRQDPGLKPRLPGVIADAEADAARQAIRELRRHGEDPAGIVARRDVGAIYSADQILGDWLPERPDLS